MTAPLELADPGDGGKTCWVRWCTSPAPLVTVMEWPDEENAVVEHQVSLCLDHSRVIITDGLEGLGEEGPKAAEPAPPEPKEEAQAELVEFPSSLDPDPTLDPANELRRQLTATTKVLNLTVALLKKRRSGEFVSTGDEADVLAAATIALEGTGVKPEESQLQPTIPPPWWGVKTVPQREGTWRWQLWVQREQGSTPTLTYDCPAVFTGEQEAVENAVGALGWALNQYSGLYEFDQRTL